MRVSIPHVINLFKPARGILSDARQAAQSEVRLHIDKSQIIKQNRAVISLAIACNMLVFFSCWSRFVIWPSDKLNGGQEFTRPGWAGISVPATAPTQMLSWRVSRLESRALHQELHEKSKIQGEIRLDTFLDKGISFHNLFSYFFSGT